MGLGGWQMCLVINYNAIPFPACTLKICSWMLLGLWHFCIWCCLEWYYIDCPKSYIHTQRSTDINWNMTMELSTVLTARFIKEIGSWFKSNCLPQWCIKTMGAMVLWPLFTALFVWFHTHLYCLTKLQIHDFCKNLAKYLLTIFMHKT